VCHAAIAGLFAEIKTREDSRKGTSHMMSFVKRLITEESGQDLAEYGIALAVIAIGAAAAAVVIAGDVTTLWETGRDAIQSALP